MASIDRIGDPIATESGDAHVLDVRDIDVTFVEGGDILPVLAGLSLTAAPGEFVSVIGPSGSGKSTLLDAIAGLIEPERGEIAISGENGGRTARLGRSSYMKQRDLLLPWRTVIENAALPLELAGIPRREARAKARDRLDAFGLAGFGDAYPSQLSGGMRQRVAFLRTMLRGRPLVLLDEPFGALDALTRAAMQDWLLGRIETERRTFLFVTHDVEEAVFLSDRVLVLTERPARVAHIEPIELPRPRTRSLVTEVPFIRHKAAILAALGLISGGPA